MLRLHFINVGDGDAILVEELRRPPLQAVHQPSHGFFLRPRPGYRRNGQTGEKTGVHGPDGNLLRQSGGPAEVVLPWKKFTQRR